MAVTPLITPPYKLKLFVSPWSAPCQRAINNLSALLANRYKDTYRLEVIDIRKHPKIAFKENVLAVPFLVRDLPEPRVCLLGDMSNLKKVIAKLGTLPQPDSVPV